MIPEQRAHLVQRSFRSLTTASLTDHVEKTGEIDVLEIRIGQST